MLTFRPFGLNLTLRRLKHLLEAFDELDLLVLTLISHPLCCLAQFKQRLFKTCSHGCIDVFALDHLLLDRLLQGWEILRDVLADDCHTLFASSPLLFDVVLEQFLFLPDRVRDALDDLVTSFAHIGKAFCQCLLSLCNLSLPLIQLLCFIAPFGIQEIDDMSQRVINTIEFTLCLINDLLENVFKLRDLALVLACTTRLLYHQSFLKQLHKLRNTILIIAQLT